MMRRAIMVLLVVGAASAFAETRVRITGMKHKSESQVSELLGGRLVHVRENPAAAHLADDAAFMLRSILRKDGYGNAEVDWKILGPDEIVLEVKEGVRYSLSEVRVSGVPKDDSRKLARIYARPAEADRPAGLGEPPFREGDVEPGLSNLRQEMNARGHWAAEVELLEKSVDESTGRVSVDIEVRSGPVFRIGGPRVHSADGRGVKLAGETARQYEGRIASTANLNAMRAAVEEKAVSRGYPDAVIRMGRAKDAGGNGQRFVPEFSIDLGTRVRLRGLEIEGLERTNPERIASRVKGMEGDWYDQAAMNKHVRAFLATGAFSSARVETREAGERLIDATLHFEEGRAREITLAAGLGTYQGFITRASYGDRNLGGELLGLAAGMELGSRGVLGDVRVTDPWLMGTDTMATAHFFAIIYGHEGYLKYESGIDGALSRSFGDHYLVELMGGYSVVSVERDGLPRSALGQDFYQHARLRLTQTLDFRDNPVLPKSGWHLTSPLEIGAALGDESAQYFKAGLEGGWFHQVSRKTQVGIGGEFGVLASMDESADFPIDLRLFNGGARSVRSFPERELGPLANGYPTGGEAMWNVNLEVVRSLAGVVKGVWFFDAGSLDRNYEDFGSRGVELATGVGLRLELPVGPVRLEYGHNLTRDRGEPSGAFHFAIGHAY